MLDVFGCNINCIVKYGDSVQTRMQKCKLGVYSLSYNIDMSYPGLSTGSKLCLFKTISRPI